ncbi:signal recognition particle [Peterkaempfera bronchialis]|uniref:Signal recognition particle n=2 Tax=Peterkaempfera bronchialis TaxID=2126346 RepID=A0A345SYH0_9ACTN|nr:signal recognition particle [Peterkaempfera bronchialis]
MAWPTGTGRRHATRLCVVELALYLLERLCPGEPALSAWTLLGGYRFGLVRQDTLERRRAFRIARHQMWRLRRPRTWERALEQYRSFPEEVRGYAVPDPSLPPQRVANPVAPGRWNVYEEALTSEPLFYLRDRLPLAEPGQAYRFVQGKLQTSVSLPDYLPVLEARPHALHTPVPRKDPVEVSRDELLATAEWMDLKLKIKEKHKTWHYRVDRLEFDVLDPVGQEFVEGRSLSVDGLLHLVGMVGAGKSTLRDVLSVHLAREGRKVAVVVGDVAEQLSLLEMLRQLHVIKAAPVLGTSTRARNAQRMHRRLSSRGTGSLLTHKAEHFTYLSTACPLDALRGLEATGPPQISEAPCTSLYPIERPSTDPSSAHGFESASGDTAATTDDPADARAHGCPLWGGCPRQRGAGELVDADIWVANPASLLYGLVPSHQNRERARFLEVAVQRSDLIVIDEADRVQMQLDSMFVPSATLVGRSPDSWLDSLQSHTANELARRGRLQLSDSDVVRWSSALTLVIAATNRIYSMLMRHEKLSSWVQADYFSTWTIQQKLVDDWFRGEHEPEDDQDEEPDLDPDTDTDTDTEDDPEESDVQEPTDSGPKDKREARRDAVTALLDEFRDDPLGDHRPTDPDHAELVRLTQDLLHTLDDEETHRRAQTTLSGLLWDPLDGRIDLPTRTHRLEFMLLLAVLQHRLDVLTDLWPLVEARLNLEATDNQLSRRPPADFSPLVPESPMGNILGFQFLSEEEPGAVPGTSSPVLRFFRCAGVGRSLLLGLHEMTGPGDTAPPHVLLMSGTSWAGTAAGAHVLAPVGAILKAPPRERRAIQQTTFRKLFLKGPDGKPLHLSGTRPERRPKVLELMLDLLARPRDGRARSDLDQELDLITSSHRKRLLLLVGSYEEARIGAKLLHGIPQWQGKVCRLVADDVEAEVSFGGTAPDASDFPHTDDEPLMLRRGDVARFATTGAKILIAPLLSLERGHNILNDLGQAAIGSVFFLARPHPRPHDINLAVQGINSWVTRYLLKDGSFDELVTSSASLDAAGRAFRSQARGHWRRLLTRPMAWPALSDEEKEAFTWDRAVVMWQVIGRLVRGGVPARVVFVDSKFAEREATGRGPDTFRTGLLASMLHVLKPYLTDDPGKPLQDRQLVRALYEPLYLALKETPEYRSDTRSRTTRRGERHGH